MRGPLVERVGPARGGRRREARRRGGAAGARDDGREPPAGAARLYPLLAGRHYPKVLVRPAQGELEGFVRLLEREGIAVRRPDVVDFARRFASPHWRSNGFCTASPRDGILVVGDEIIETPMAWRSRYFEVHAYRTLLKDYWARGARWVSAPKPELRDELYDAGLRTAGEG